MVDHAALKTNQAMIILFLATAFLLDRVEILAFVAAVMIVGTVIPALALFQQIYRKILKPLGLVKPQQQEDRPGPHRFAQGFGGVVLGFAVLSIMEWGWTDLGWGFALMVMGLAMINLISAFCLGCFFFFQLERIGIIGHRTGDA